MLMPFWLSADHLILLKHSFPIDPSLLPGLFLSGLNESNITNYKIFGGEKDMWVQEILILLKCVHRE